MNKKIWTSVLIVAGILVAGGVGYYFINKKISADSNSWFIDTNKISTVKNKALSEVQTLLKPGPGKVVKVTLTTSVFTGAILPLVTPTPTADSSATSTQTEDGGQQGFLPKSGAIYVSVVDADSEDCNGSTGSAKFVIWLACTNKFDGGSCDMTPWFNLDDPQYSDLASFLNKTKPIYTEEENYTLGTLSLCSKTATPTAPKTATPHRYGPITTTPQGARTPAVTPPRTLTTTPFGIGSHPTFNGNP